MFFFVSYEFVFFFYESFRWEAESVEEISGQRRAWSFFSMQFAVQSMGRMNPFSSIAKDNMKNRFGNHNNAAFATIIYLQNWPDPSNCLEINTGQIDSCTKTQINTVNPEQISC